MYAILPLQPLFFSLSPHIAGIIEKEFLFVIEVSLGI